MPTETFFNLPQEKKNKIIMAIKNEFARVSFDKVSINKIVQDANISRGSFYMYFEDKKDMLIYVLSNYHEEVMSTIKESFKDNNGDIFEVFKDILKFTTNFGTSKENIAFCINIFSDQTVQNDVMLQFANRSRQKEFFDLFKDHIHINTLNLQSPKDVDDIIDILISITQKATMDIFLCLGEKDEILEAYNNKIAILKRGMLKENI
ncbi:TetR/AcrR family transcriptional regulator [Clostridium hydrogeniformans]|uniref:TetR/AcrR family transcriptional regulator n=1 Tax=Clostridium hydrogeniformans TaxID=349933 RepID=UPI00068AEA0C|nr:TetR/AcrR family transcriptional regulator [Clostridium hydrogeniformans]